MTATKHVFSILTILIVLAVSSQGQVTVPLKECHVDTTLVRELEEIVADSGGVFVTVESCGKMKISSDFNYSGGTPWIVCPVSPKPISLPASYRLHNADSQDKVL